MNEATLMEERLRAIISRKREQLNSLETEMKPLRKEIAELEFILGSSAKAPEAEETHLAHWSDEDDTIIVNHIRAAGGPVQATVAAKELTAVLHRTPAAIRARMRQLLDGGKLKTKKRSKNSTAPMYVEAAA